MKRLMTVNEVAEITGWKPKTIRQKIWRREIDFVRLGRNIRIEEDSLRRLIERSRIPARNSAA